MSFNFIYTTSTLTRNSLRQNKQRPSTTNHSVQFATLWMYYHLQQKLRNKTTITPVTLNKEGKYVTQRGLEKDSDTVEMLSVKHTEFYPNVIIE